MKSLNLTIVALLSLSTVPASVAAPLSTAADLQAKMTELMPHLKGFLKGGNATRAAGKMLKPKLEKAEYDELLRIGNLVRRDPKLAHGMEIVTALQGAEHKSNLFFMALHGETREQAIPLLRSVARLDEAGVAAHREAFPRGRPLRVRGSRTSENTFLHPATKKKLDSALRKEREALLTDDIVYRRPNLASILYGAALKKGRLPTLEEFLKEASGDSDTVNAFKPGALNPTLEKWYQLSVSTPERRLLILQQARNVGALTLEQVFSIGRSRYINELLRKAAGERVVSEPELPVSSDQPTI